MTKVIHEEIMAKFFLNFVKNFKTTDPRNSVNPKCKTTQKHIIIKLIKTNDNLKSNRDKRQIIYKRTKLRMATGFSSETSLWIRQVHQEL